MIDRLLGLAAIAAGIDVALHTARGDLRAAAALVVCAGLAMLRPARH